MTKRGLPYSPNHIPATQRWINIVLSLFLILYGTYGVLVDDLYLPGRRASGSHYHGFPLWVLYASILLAAANLLSVVFDHYDKRDNEINYKRFAAITQGAAWVCFIGTLILDLFMFRTATRG